MSVSSGDTHNGMSEWVEAPSNVSGAFKRNEHPMNHPVRVAFIHPRLFIRSDPFPVELHRLVGGWFVEW